MKRFGKVARGLAIAGATAGLMMTSAVQATDTIKVGVLHSLSGTMAISETTLKDTVLMMVDDLNKKGGLLGKKVEAFVVDPASNWPLFAEKAREHVEQNFAPDHKPAPASGDMVAELEWATGIVREELFKWLFRLFTVRLEEGFK